MFPNLGPRYQFIEKLGEDYTGTINLAIDNQLGCKVAIKTFWNLGHEELQTIQEQTLLLRELNHPHILSIKNFILGGHLVQEYFEGRDLHNTIRLETGPFVPRLALKTIKSVISAIKYIHFRNLLHLNINPMNILIGKYSEQYDPINLDNTDYFFAKVVCSPHVLNNNQNLIINQDSLMYMAPEQLDAGALLSRKTDIYSLGLLLHIMITGRCPLYHDTSREKILNKIKYTPLDRAYDIYPAPYNKIFQKIIDKATHKNPDERYQNCDELSYDIHNAEIEITNSLKEKR